MTEPQRCGRLARRLTIVTPEKVSSSQLEAYTDFTKPGFENLGRASIPGRPLSLVLTMDQELPPPKDSWPSVWHAAGI